MTIEQFGQTIKKKYPQYQDISDIEIGQKMITKYPQYQDMISQPESKPVDAFLGGHPVLKGISDFIGTTGLSKGIAQGIFLKFTPEGKDVLKQIEGGKAKYSDLENIIGQGVSNKEIIGSAVQTGTFVGATGLRAATSLVGRAAQFGGVGAVMGAGKAIEEDKPTKEIVGSTILSGILSGMFPIATKVIGTGIKAVAPHIGEITSSVLGNLIGKPAEVINEAFKNPYKVAEGLARKVIPVDVRRTAIADLNALKSEAQQTFKKTLTSQQKLHPFGKTGQILIKQEMGNIKGSLTNILRQFKVSVSNTGELNFDKMASPIISGGERRNVQLAFDTIKNQKDFTPEGVQAVISRLSKLTKFGEGPVKESSAIIRNLYSNYRDAIIKVYPELGGARTKFANERKVLDELSNVLSSDKMKPTQIISGVRRLSNIFNEDNELYIDVLRKLEQRTGKDIISDLAASEFARIAPESFGSKIAQAGLLAGGFLYNPYIFAAIPLFSPRFVGKATIAAGKAAILGSKIGEKITKTGIGKVVVPAVTKSIGQ